MAERFVNGYAVSHGALSSMVGTATARGADLLAEVDAYLVEEVSMTLGVDQEALAELLDEIFQGDLVSDHAYQYLRALEIILNARTVRLEPDIEMVVTYYLPNDSDGRWNPVLRQLGLTELAESWAEPRLQFPWSNSERPSPVAWPLVTGLTPSDLCLIKGELATGWRNALGALDACFLTERGHAAAAAARNELTTGLEILTAWVNQAAAKSQGLVLWMDGDR